MDTDTLRRIDILAGMGEEHLARLASIAKAHTYRKGEYVFLLGDAADRLYAVLSGKIDLCFPLSVQNTVTDISVDAKTPGETMGWSAMVKPFRFTLSARAAGPSELIAFPRHELQEIFDTEPAIGCYVMQRVAEVVGHRLLRVQAMWARCLQRELTSMMEGEDDTSG